MNGLEGITAAFDEARARGHAALMPYITLGFPNQESSVDIVQAISQAGADLIESGVPFSDPLADGPMIQHSTQIALEKGTTPRGCLEMVTELRRRGVTQPFLLMGYYNPILSYGAARYIMDACAAGASGLIVPDLPVDEAEEIETLCRLQHLALVYMLAPTSTNDRAIKITAHTSGFLYLVSVTGVTGTRKDLDPHLEAFIQRTYQAAHTPLAVGFGISTPEQVHQVGKLADGVIVGSALVSAIAQAVDPVSAASSFVRMMKNAL